MARIIGDKALNARLTRLARGADVTPALLKGAERTRTAYIEKLDEISYGRQDVRYTPRRVVTVSRPGEPPNTDNGDLKNSTGVNSERRNQAEAFASASYAEALEYGTDKMKARPAMNPAFEETKEQVVQDVAEVLRRHNRG